MATKKLKYTANLRNEKSLNNELPYIGLENIESKTGQLLYNEEDEAKIVEGISALFYKKDVLFGKLRPYLAKSIIASFDGRCSTELLVMNCKEILNNKFLYYNLLSKWFVDLVDSSTYGAKMPRASWDYIGQIKFDLPDNIVQVKIANFLDLKTERIRTQIKKIEKMIGLLKEKKEILIINAVTKGINPDVTMKDSGIDWIGKIPKHWGKSKIKYNAPFFTGWTPPSKSDEYYKGDVPWANISDLGEKYITKTENHISEEAVDDFKMIPSPKGSILFSFKLSIGQTSFAGIDLYTNEAIATFDKININRKYFYYMASVFICKNANENIYCAPILNQYLIKNANIVIPNSEVEQQQIAEFLDVETSKIERAINLNSDLIKKLIEYQEALITAAVTGKIDVRSE